MVAHDDVHETGIYVGWQEQYEYCIVQATWIH